MDIAKKYFIPLLVAAIALLTAVGDPNERILRSIPIIPGRHQLEYALGFAMLALVLACVIYRHNRLTQAGQDQT